MKKQRLYRVTGISLLALVAAVPSSVLATAYTAAADGNWSAPATWGGSGYPANSGDTATINVTRTIDVDVSVTIDDLTVTGNFVQTLNASTPSTLTVNTFTSGNINNFTIGNGLSLNIAGTGLYVTRGGTVNGTLNVLDGATLTYNNGSQTQTGTGIVRVASGGTVAVTNNSVINTATIDNGGLVEIGVSGTSTFGGRSITGGGEWRVNSGTVLFNNANQRLSLDTVNALFTASVGNVSFGSATQGMHTVGAFNMSGVNTVTFSGGTARTNAIGRASAFHNLSVTAGTALDLAPFGGAVSRIRSAAR